MNDYSERQLIATTLYGLEPVLAGELKKIGASEITEQNGAVRFRGDRELMYRANLMCRTAIRILLPLREFSARDGEELYREAGRVDWQGLIDHSMTLAVDAVVRNSSINNSMYAAQRCKDAVVDQVRTKAGKRPSVNTSHPDLRINLFIDRNKAILSLDSSGDTLHRRGYRMQKGQAPLNEVLAAGLVLLSDWNGEETLIDPMCGSGTIVIEAAMMATGIFPGNIRRHYGFRKWKSFDSKLLKKVVKDMDKYRKKIRKGIIFGSDISGRRITEAKANAERAGVANFISFQKLPFEKLRPKEPKGILIMNPPYGERIAARDLAIFYKSLGDNLKNNFQGYRAWIFSGYSKAAKAVGLRTSERKTLFNGPIECRFLKYELYRGSRKSKYLEKDS